MTINKDEYFMQKALQEAEKAFEAGEVPVGAIITINEKIIAKAHNLTEMLHDVTAHAEIQAITSASEYLGGKYLKDCTLYVTLEPCVMCAGALYWSQIGRIVYGALDTKRGYHLHTKGCLTTSLSSSHKVPIPLIFFMIRSASESPLAVFRGRSI